MKPFAFSMRDLQSAGARRKGAFFDRPLSCVNQAFPLPGGALKNYSSEMVWASASIMFHTPDTSAEIESAEIAAVAAMGHCTPFEHCLLLRKRPCSLTSPTPTPCWITNISGR